MKTLVMATLLSVAAMPALAKGDKMLRGFDLTDTQKAELMELRQAHKAEMQGLKATQMNAVRALLTPEQQALFDERRAKMAEKMAEKRAKKQAKRWGGET